MLQVRWSLKPSTNKEKKTLASTFNPLTDRLKAHRDFDQHATEVPRDAKRMADCLAFAEQMHAPTCVPLPEALKAKRQKLEIAAAVAADASSSDTERASDTASAHDDMGGDIDILDFDCFEGTDGNTSYDVDLQAIFPSGREVEAPTTAPRHSPCSATMLRDLEDLFELADNSVLVVSERSVRELADCGRKM